MNDDRTFVQSQFTRRRFIAYAGGLSAIGLGLGRSQASEPANFEPATVEPGAASITLPDVPDPLIVEAYDRAARQNVLAAVNEKIFPGYWSVCADGQGFGYGYTYPSLDGHQMTDALLWLNQTEVVRKNWAYVRTFQRPNGCLPLAILPPLAGQRIGVGDALSAVDANGGLYQHWVPGNPLAALASPTYIQNADVIFRHTGDLDWLTDQIDSVNLAAEFLVSLTTEQGAVKGAGYYVERPTRFESDGVAQCHAIDAFLRLAALNRVVGKRQLSAKFTEIADRIRSHFRTQFWVKDHFAEYFHPQHGLIASHGLTDVDWAALALDVATAEQVAILWPQLKDEKRFHYGGMPTGIATRPETYEAWEFTHPDRHDLAAMGRVWYLEAQARARMGDADGLLRGIRQVCEMGRDHDYYWRERYHPNEEGGATPAGAEKYCEYAANLIRIIQRFLMGIDLGVDGTITLAPVVTDDYWSTGFGQTVTWRDRNLSFRFQHSACNGTYSGQSSQRLVVRLPNSKAPARATINGRAAQVKLQQSFVTMELPPAAGDNPSKFEVARNSE